MVLEKCMALLVYDIITKIESYSEEKIQKIVTNVIRKMPTIHSTITLTRSENEQLFQTSEKLIGFHAWSKQCSSIRCYS